MARPIKDGMEYFPHDTDAASDEKIEILMANYGAKGYAFYFYMLERIYRNPNFEIRVIDAETRQLFANKLSITLQEYDSILETALKFGSFCKKSYEERGVLTSQGIKKRADIVLKKRISMRKRVTGELLTQKPHQEVHKVKESNILKSVENDALYNKKELPSLTPGQKAIIKENEERKKKHAEPTT